MNRREFLLKSTAAAAFSALGAPATNAQTPPENGTFRPLRDGTGYYLGRGGTIGWLVGPEGIAAVDTQFPEWAGKFLAGLPGRDSRNVDILVNSHHHVDHTAGNPVFRPVTTSIVAQVNVPDLQRAAAQRANSVDRQVYADTTFEQTWRHELGGETVAARYFGPAHTNGDVVVHFERANVIHLGDLIFNRIYPVCDRPGGCSIAGWIAVAEKVVANYPADAIYMCGHGSTKFGVTGGHADILVFRDYLTALLDHVRKEIAAGRSRDEIMALENLPGFDDFHVPPPNRLGGNLGAAYDELTAG